MRQVTASQTELFLACQRPWDPNLPSDEEETEGKQATEAARYGSAFHYLMQKDDATTAEALVKYGFEPDPSLVKELTEHYLLARKVLEEWKTSRGLTVVHREVPLAFNVGWVTPARVVGFDEGSHTYELEDGEIGGTSDLLLADPIIGARTVLDYKTGIYKDYSSPERDAQMLTLAWMTGAFKVAVLHAPRGSFPVVYEGEVTGPVLDGHLEAIKKAWARIGDGSMRNGPHCRFCPAKSNCPTQVGELLVQTTALVRKVTGIPLDLANVPDLGEFHSMLGDLEKLAKVARSELKERVRSGEVIERPRDGKTLMIQTAEMETLSKSSIVKALGAKMGEAEIERLRALGCMNTTKVEKLVAL